MCARAYPQTLHYVEVSVYRRMYICPPNFHIPKYMSNYVKCILFLMYYELLIKVNVARDKVLAI